jgi:hypothetical protein
MTINSPFDPSAEAFDAGFTLGHESGFRSGYAVGLRDASEEARRHRALGHIKRRLAQRSRDGAPHSKDDAPQPLQPGQERIANGRINAHGGNGQQ